MRAALFLLIWKEKLRTIQHSILHLYKSLRQFISIGAVINKKTASLLFYNNIKIQ